MDARKPRPLNLRQELFVRHYLGQAKGNATQAARLAGYEGDDDTLRVTAARLMDHPIIAMRIKEHVTEVAMPSDEVLAQLAEIALAPWRDFLFEQRNSRGEVVSVRMDLKDKVRALELLGKYHKLFTDNVTVGTAPIKAVIGVDLDDV